MIFSDNLLLPSHR